MTGATARHHQAPAAPASPGRACAACGYPLDGVMGAVCPECGAAIVAHLPASGAASGPEAPAAAARDDVGYRAARGLLWMFVNTVASKVTGTLMQLALAWLLLPNMWGLVGLAYTVSTFALYVQNPGIEEVLVQRHARFRRWAPPAFWMSLACGLLGGALMAAAAPVAAAAYREPALVPLLLVMAAGSPIAGLATVPRALLRSQMRYKYLAAVAFAATLLTQGLTVLLAWLGWGPYAFVVPQIPAAALTVALVWRAAPVRVGRRPLVRRWRFMAADVGAIFGQGVLGNLTGQGDRMVLGLVGAGAAAVGQYTFAFQFAMQAIQLLAGNLGNVLFSGLGQFAGDPARQGRAALSAGRVLALVGMPLCFLQAAAAEPAMRVLFMSKADPAKWEPAVPLVQMLSVGMGFNCIGWAGISLGQALGRFRSLLGLFIVAAAVFFGAAWGGAVIGGRVGWRVEVGVAAGVAAYFVVMSCVGFAVILRWAGIGLGQLAAIYPVPMVGGGGAALAGWWVAQQTHGEGRPAEVVRGAVTGLVFFAIYGPIAWFGAPGARRQVTGRVRELLPRRFRQRVRGVPA